MSRAPFAGLPLIGWDRSSVSETVLFVVSVSEKSGAFCVTCGAPVDGGNHLEATNATKMNLAIIKTLSAATTEATIFDRRRRSGAKARRIPMNSSSAATTNRTRLAQGKSRVLAQLTKTSG